MCSRQGSAVSNVALQRQKLQVASGSVLPAAINSSCHVTIAASSAVRPSGVLCRWSDGFDLEDWNSLPDHLQELVLKQLLLFYFLTLSPVPECVATNKQDSVLRSLTVVICVHYRPIAGVYEMSKAIVEHRT